MIGATIGCIIALFLCNLLGIGEFSIFIGSPFFVFGLIIQFKMQNPDYSFKKLLKFGMDVYKIPLLLLGFIFGLGLIGALLSLLNYNIKNLFK